MGFIDPAALALGFAAVVLILWAPGVRETAGPRKRSPAPTPSRPNMHRASRPVVPLARIHKSPGLSPVRLPSFANIRGPISSLSWKAKV